MTNEKHVKVGLLGGTFNPVHLGHLRGAEEVREILGLDTVFFVPSATPPHKDSSETASSSERLQMVELAIHGNPFFRVSDVELKREGPSYTIDTLKHFSSEFPDHDFYFIIGTDLVPELDNWESGRTLFEFSNFAVLARPGFSSDFLSMLPLEFQDDFRYDRNEGEVKFYMHKSSNTAALVHIRGIEVSSTKVRQLLNENKSIKYLVPDQVENYILSNNLYAKETSNRF